MLGVVGVPSKWHHRPLKFPRLSWLRISGFLHGIATLFLLPVYLIGMILTWHRPGAKGADLTFSSSGNRTVEDAFWYWPWTLLATAGGMMAGGLTFFGSV
jgi:hypothetical protein